MFSSNCFSSGCAIKSNGIYLFLIRCLINVWYQRQNLIQKFQLFVKLSVVNLMFFILIIVCLKLFHIISQHLYRKYHRVNAWKQKKNSRYICSNCSPTSEVHTALTLLFPAHLYLYRSVSVKLTFKPIEEVYL